jgi:hypothetical protein
MTRPGASPAEMHKNILSRISWSRIMRCVRKGETSVDLGINLDAAYLVAINVSNNFDVGVNEGVLLDDWKRTGSISRTCYLKVCAAIFHQAAEACKESKTGKSLRYPIEAERQGARPPAVRMATCHHAMQLSPE